MVEDVGLPRDTEISIANSGAKREATPDRRESKKPCRPQREDSMDLGSLTSQDILNISTGFDFSVEDSRREILKQVADAQPRLVIASVMCRRRPEDMGWRESQKHNGFITQLYRYQQSRGRFFLHVQPTSTNLSSVAKVKEGLETTSYQWANTLRQTPAQNP